MISLSTIVNNNLQMLKEQEADLLKSLEFIQKAKALFESQGDGTRGGKRRGRKSGTAVSTKKGSKKRGRKKKSGAAKKKAKTKRGKRPGYLNSITSILKERNKPISSGELIDTMFKSQTKDKDIKHFRTLVYPTLTKAYKTKSLQLKKGLIHLGKTAA